MSSSLTGTKLFRFAAADLTTNSPAKSARSAPSAPENRTTSPALKSCTPTTVTETPSAQSYAELSAQDKKLTCATFLYW